MNIYTILQQFLGISKNTTIYVTPTKELWYLPSITTITTTTKCKRFQDYFTSTCNHSSTLVASWPIHIKHMNGCFDMAFGLQWIQNTSPQASFHSAMRCTTAMCETFLRGITRGFLSCTHLSYNGNLPILLIFCNTFMDDPYLSHE